MADARFPERWLIDRRFRRLSLDGFRSFVAALTWSVGNRTDGYLTAADLELVPMFNMGAVPELVHAELLVVDGTGWRIVDYKDTQTSKAEFDGLNAKREADRLRKVRERSHKSGDHALCLPQHCDQAVSRDSPRDVTDVTSDGLHRQGKARPGSDTGGSVDEQIDEQTGEVLSLDPWAEPASGRQENPSRKVSGNPSKCSGCGLAPTARNPQCRQSAHDGWRQSA